jgi:NAD(P)-dependent dehydrogenase (short-subunit alcohol dehydrogenase family)
MSKLEGKVAVITGGNSGIGLATAQHFVAEGAHVFVTGRRQGELDAAVKQIGKNVTAVQGEVSNLADLHRLCATVKKQKGHIEIHQRQRPSVGGAKGASAPRKDGGFIILNASIVSSTGDRPRSASIARPSRRAYLRAHLHHGSQRPQNSRERH